MFANPSPGKQVFLMIKTKKKQKVIADFKIHEGDTGSADVQIAVLTERIEELSRHLKKHVKDNHSRRGLLQMVSQRRKFLSYLKKNDEKRYLKVVKKLGLKK